MKNLLFAALASLTLSAAYAQTSADDIESRVAAIEKETGQIKKQLFSMPRVSGYINIPYDYTSTQGEKASSGSFNIKRARLKVSGDIAEKFQYCMQAELAGSPRILDAYVRYNLRPWLGFQAGQSKTVFSMENKVYVPLMLETIEYTASSNALGGSDDISGVKSTGRDVGISAFGALFHRDGFNILQYAVAIYNGSGINAGDDNKSKDWAAAVDVNPCRELAVALSAYFGEYGKEQRHRERYSAALKYETRKLLVRSEYLYGSTGSANGTFATQGGYVTLSYWVLPSLRPVVRYDVLQRNTRSALLQNEYLVGLDYWPVKKHLRLQANYTYTDFCSSQHRNKHKVALMLTASF